MDALHGSLLHNGLVPVLPSAGDDKTAARESESRCDGHANSAIASRDYRDFAS